MRNLFRIFARIGLLFAASQPVLAQDQAAAQEAAPISLVGDVMVERSVQADDGTTRVELVPPTVAVPGDRLVFRTNYTNSGGDAVQRFVVTNPVHPAVRLAPDTDPALTVSVNGGESWGELAELTVTGADGTVRAATLEDVTHIRWVLATVAPGATGTLQYHAIIR